MANNIVVVGGGTAGWLAALYANIRFPRSNITVVQSKEIGILGAGEATTPHMVFILSFLGINIFDFIKATNATFKNGIKFCDWGDKDYYHNFYDPLNISSHNSTQHINDFIEPNIDFGYVYSKLYDIDIKTLFISSSISDSFLSPTFKETSNSNFVDLKSHIGWALHFDAHLVAKYFSTIGINRGIVEIDSKVSKIQTDKNENITSICLENNQNLAADFVIDATGFNRLIIGKFYKSKWISHKKHLTVNSAIPFTIPTSEKIEPYTTATAMKYGWSWKIPLQNRYGCGYVFDDKYIKTDDAIAEIEGKFGIRPETDKMFKFDAGYFDRVWIKNCLAVGLAANFIEPLESTSLMQTIRTLTLFFNNFNNINQKNEKQKKIFNTRIIKDILETMNFVFLHYVTNKNQSDFWTHYRRKKNQPYQVKEIMEILQYEIPSFHDKSLYSTLWSYSSYTSIIFGNNLVKQEILKNYDFYRAKKQYFDDRIELINQKKQLLQDHKYFLDNL